MKVFFANSILMLIVFLSIIACRKDQQVTTLPDNPLSTFGTAQFKVILKAGSQDVVWDSLCNTNAAGNVYSINTVNFYVSDIILKRNDGELFRSNEVFYIDPSDSLKSSFLLDSLPNGTYVEMSFLLGLDSLRNLSYGLDNTADNINMIWPSAMGGGYHFLKLEGHYLDSLSTMKGYAIHLGQNENSARVSVSVAMLQMKSIENYAINFEINEVFMNPYTYDLNVDPQFTMSDTASMTKIKNNIQDAFTVYQKN